MKLFFIRLIWRILGLPFRLKPLGKARDAYPSWIEIFVNEVPGRHILEDLGRTYAQIFTDPMWGEAWEPEEAIEKIQKEIVPQRPSVLSYMIGDAQDPIAGFCWGAVITAGQIEEEATSALGVKPEGLEEALRKKGAFQVFYYHEVALLKHFRGGFEPLKYLLRPGLELACEENVKGSMFWSSPKSKIVPLTRMLGYGEIFRTQNQHGVDIVFLYHPNHRSILKVAQNVSGKFFSRVFAKISGKK